MKLLGTFPERGKQLSGQLGGKSEFQSQKLIPMLQFLSCKMRRKADVRDRKKGLKLLMSSKCRNMPEISEIIENN